MKKANTTVFISYSTKDSVFADLVKMKLNAVSIDVWLDQDKLNAGQEWRNEIDLGIIEADAFILILTPDSCKSAYVTYEWAFAIGRKKKIIPLLYKSSDIHPRIDVLHHLDFTNQRKGPWEQLFTQIEKSKKENIIEEKPSNLVSSMTVEDLKQLLSGTISLANATAKKEGRKTNNSDLSEAALNIANANTKLKRSDNKSATILWVDDIPDNNEYEREVFSSLGFKFDLVITTNKALQKLKSKKYSAIISDMGRAEGGREGYILLEKLRMTDKTTPYFIYAGSNKLEHKKEAKQRGAQGTTNSAQELVELVTRYVSAK